MQYYHFISIKGGLLPPMYKNNIQSLGSKVNVGRKDFSNWHYKVREKKQKNQVFERQICILQSDTRPQNVKPVGHIRENFPGNS